LSIFIFLNVKSLKFSPRFSVIIKKRLVSEIYAGKAASQSRNVYVGDAILSVNGIDLRNLKHNDAVKILTDQEGQVCRFLFLRFYF